MLAQITSLQSLWLGRARDLLIQFAQWWLREFLALFPAPIGRWLLGSGGTTLVLSQDDAFVEMHLRGSGGDLIDSMRLVRRLYSPTSLDDFLHRHELKRANVAIGIRLLADQIFQRHLVLPIQASRALDEILIRDLAQKTPFRLAEIYCDRAVEKNADKLVVTQQLTKRDSVEAAARSLMLDLAGVTFVTTCDEAINGSVIVLRKERDTHTRWVGRTAMALGASAVLIALIAGASRYSHQESSLETLRSQIATASLEARKVREVFAKLERTQAGVSRILVQKRDSPMVVDIWEEATRLLPSDSWLTELIVKDDPAIGGYRLSISGFSTAAAKLVLTFDQSPLFDDAALTTAVAVDPVEQRERFAMQARLRDHGSAGAIP
jgi:general secretion pathway protein L